MSVNDFNKWNTLLGWVSFSIAFVVYALTVEPTGSFWDAGEYITTSAKLQVGHPPGAPLLQMIGAFFSLFALGDVTKIALMVNMVSVVSSAFTILFTFWIITGLLKDKLLVEENNSKSKVQIILTSGFVGALAFTFSDSFWFNAGETEVYASASLLMSLLLWLGIQWVNNLDTPRGHKWLLLICFVIGLVFGVQFMGFLAIPSIGLLYYFKKYEKITIVNFLTANVVVVGILMLVYQYSLTYIFKLFGWSELFFVNDMGLPFNSGTIIMGLLLAGLFYFLLTYTKNKGLVRGNLITLCFMFLILGFSSWLMLPIRANARTVVNENNPEDARSLLAYYNREQYPSVESPVYGTYYSNSFADAGEPRDEKPKYEKDLALGKYVIVNDYKDALPGPDPKHMGLLPRMWSEQNAENYMRYYGRLNFNIKAEYLKDNRLRDAVRQFKDLDAAGEIDTDQYIGFLRELSDYIDVEPPTIADNLRYLFDFQWGYMYSRYFFWNFVGRQNDIQGRFDNNGQWLSGIKGVDAYFHGSQENLPSDTLNNKARNTYFFLPLILGLIGIFFQIATDPKRFWVLLVFFLFTGLAIQFYTNPAIFQPRERDYSLVGSFFIFCLWIGLGVYSIYEALCKWVTPKITAPVVGMACLLAVPVLMGYQNWDDHNRAGRYTAQSTAKAYLSSCQKDAGSMLFTIGDNDTFPLWYVQEIEEYRRDVRVINTSLFATDWYIDQMKRKAYESDPIPSQLTHNHYRFGTREAIYHQGLTDARWDIKDFMDWISSDKPNTKFRFLFEKQGRDVSNYPESTLNIVYYPTHKIRVPVNKANVLASGLVKEKDSALIVDYIDIDLPQSALTKQRILMLDILANNDWKRPIYFSGGSFDNAEYLWMKSYLQLDGLVYKLVPIKTETNSSFQMGRIDSDLMYDIVMSWEWGNSGDLDIYHDPQTRSQGLSFRNNLARLVEQLIKENKIEKAREVIDLAMTHIPFERFGFYPFVEGFYEGYFQIGERDKARALFEKLKKVYQEQLDYFAAMPIDEQYSRLEDILSNMEGYKRNINILVQYQDKEIAETETLIFNEYIDKFPHFVNDAQETTDYLDDPLWAQPDTLLIDSSEENNPEIIGDSVLEIEQ